MAAERTAEEVIRAIAENRKAEYLIYGLVVVVGVGIVIWGVLKEKWVPTVAGFVCSQIFWPAMAAARQTRQENVYIRRLETALSKASTPEERAMMISELRRAMLARAYKTGEREHEHEVVSA